MAENSTSQPLGSAKRPVSLRRELNIAASGVATMLLVGGGGSLLLVMVSLRHVFEGPELTAEEYWLLWAAKLVGRLSGDLLGGWILGRYLQRINPWLVLLTLAAFLVLAGLIMLGFATPDGLQWLETLGTSGAAIQVSVQLALILSIAGLGVVLGRWRCRQLAAGKKSKAKEPAASGSTDAGNTVAADDD